MLKVLATMLVSITGMVAFCVKEHGIASSLFVNMSRSRCLDQDQALRGISSIGRDGVQACLMSDTFSATVVFGFLVKLASLSDGSP